MKNRIKSFLSRNGLVIHRKKAGQVYNCEFADLSLQSRKLAFLELSIIHEITVNGWSQLVAVGAGGPETADFLERFIIKYDLNSLLIDGDEKSLKEKVTRLRSANCTNIKVQQAWLSDQEGSSEVFYFNSSDTVLAGYTSIDKNSFLNTARSLGLTHLVSSSQVQTVKLSSLILEKDISRISLLIIDAEGLDISILKDLLSTQILPSIIVVEFLAYSVEELLDLTSMLSSQNYIVYPDISDVIFIKNSLS